jgi:hypothetical protein
VTGALPVRRRRGSARKTPDAVSPSCFVEEEAGELVEGMIYGRTERERWRKSRRSESSMRLLCLRSQALLRTNLKELLDVAGIMIG